jgi:3-oxoacyl-[acyl-carrier protein] reductase
MECSFNNRVILVTGGTMGIGAAIVNNLIDSTAEIIVTGIESDQAISKSINQSSRESKNRVRYISVDFANEKSFKNFLNILNDYNKIDVCINNAGTNINNPIDKIDINDYNFLMNVNLKAPFLITQMISKKMKKNKYGRIINIASIWCIVTKAERAAYSITKHGIIGLTKTSAVELAPYNILVNAVSPGFTLTELTKTTLKEDGIKEVSKIIPIKRLANPEEIAKIVLFLASDLNTYITGQNIVIDGGFSVV